MELKILKNHKSSEIIEAIDLNAYEFAKDWFVTNKIENTEYEETDELLRVSTGIPHFSVNCISGARIPAENADETIKEIISFFKKKKLPFFWVVGPLSKPDDLKTLLTKNGFITEEYESPGMAFNLNNLIREEELIPNLEIVKVDNIETLKVWNDILLSGFGLPKELLFDFLYNMFSQLLKKDTPLQSFFLAYYKGNPIACSNAFYGAGVAGIYCVTTLEEARGKGIGTAITLAALYEAKEMGYKIAVLTSSEIGYNVYKKIGFEEYCKCQNYIWFPSSKS